MEIKYNISLKTKCGWRQEEITAIAEMLSPKRAKVVAIIDVGGNGNHGYASRTGAKRQEYSVGYFADAEIGKVKNLRAVVIIGGNDEN